MNRYLNKLLTPILAVLALAVTGSARGDDWPANKSNDEWVWDGENLGWLIFPDTLKDETIAVTFSKKYSLGNSDIAIRNGQSGNKVTFKSSDGTTNNGVSMNWSLWVGDNTSGNLVIQSGHYAFDSNLNIGTYSGNVYWTGKGKLSLTGGKLEIGGCAYVGTADSSVDNSISVEGGEMIAGSVSMATAASSGASMTVSSGTLTVNESITVGGDNASNATGNINISGTGKLVTKSIIKGSAGTANLSLNGGTLQALGVGETALIGNGVTVTVDSNGGTIDVGENDVKIAAKVTGAGAIIKKGTGTLTFTGDMSGFTGQIIVEEGCGTVSIPTASIGSIAAGTGTGTRVVGDNTIFLPNKFYWIGGLSGNWDDGSKWSLTEGGSAIGVYPANSGDKARFATTAGTVTLKTTAALTLNCDIDIPEGVTLDFVTNDRKLTHNGSVTGKGTLSMRSDISTNTWRGMYLCGDNGDFSGTVKIYSSPSQNRDQHFLSGSASSSKAIWRVYVDGANGLGEGPFLEKDATYYLGSAQVKFYNPRNTGYTASGCSFEVGALDIDSSFSAVDSNAKYGSMCKLRWIAPTATLTHDVGNLQILEICGGGTVKVGTTYSLPLRIKFSDKGGILKTAADPSAVLTQSEVAICYDDEGNNQTWATALASSNVGGIVKKGTGTLTLSAAPAWTSAQPITVMDGKLVVNDSSFANYTLGEGTKVTTVDSTLVFSPDARATVTFVDTETYSLSVSVNNSVIASGVKIDAGETLVISANAIAGYKITSILVNGVAISGNEYSVATGDVEGGVAISAVAKAVVAKIGDKEYASLEDALADAVSGDVIVLCGNVVLDKNLSLGEGVSVNANGYTITRGEYSVYCPDGYHELSESAQTVYLRSAYIWNGGAAGTWTDSVWLVNGESSSAPNQASDIVVISTAATIAMNSGRTGQLYLDADVTLTGRLTVDVIKGSGMVTFNGTTLDQGSGQQVYCDAYFTGTVNANTASLSLRGKFKGNAANISFSSSGSYTPGFVFYGDVSEFSGLYTGGRSGVNHRDSTKIYSNAFNGAAGSWDFDRDENQLNTGYAFQGGDNATYKFGWLKNDKFTLVTYHASSGDTIAKNCEVEVGAIANKNSAIYGTLSDDSNTFRKVGATSTCDLTLTESKGTVEIKEGTLNLAGSLPTKIKFTGGTLKTALDPSGCIENSSSAIVVDVGSSESPVWSTALASTNKGGLTKKGAGSLILSQTPAYTGETTVEEGVLYVPANTSLNLGSNTHKVTSDKEGYDKYIHSEKSGFLLEVF